MGDELTDQQLGRIAVWQTSLVVPVDADSNMMRPLTAEELSQVAEIVLRSRGGTNLDGFVAQSEVTSSPEERAELDAFRQWHRQHRAAERQDPRSVVVGAALEHLLRSYTTAGALAWWRRPHPQLGGRMPADLLDDPSSHQRLIDVAAGSRDSDAT